MKDAWRLIWLSARMVAGRRFWIAPLLPLFWPVFQALAWAGNMRQSDFTPETAQGQLIGFPLTVLAVGLGVRIIAGEIDRRTLEIAYTVPGGAQRVWVAKLVASLILLGVAEVLLAGAAFVFFTGYPWGGLYGAFQSAVFYLVAAMGLSVLFKSEATGALVTVGLLVANGVFTGFGQNQIRISPFWNPAALGGSDPANVLAWTIQNRIGFALIVVAITALAFARAERRETMLSG